jgi:hypothetical protein
MRLVLTKWWSQEKDHSDDGVDQQDNQGLNLEKKKEKNKNKLIKAKISIDFYFSLKTP